MIKNLQEKHNFKISKSLGQNFLTDKNIINKIVDSLEISKQDLVMEIGPGMGALTCLLSDKAKEVLAIEIDQHVIPILKEVLSDNEEYRNNVKIINDDIMKIDLEEIIGNRSFKAIGNLPYYITTPIIMRLLESEIKPEFMVFMMQKEVADRIKAEPGNKTYGSISVAVQYYCDVELVTNVSREVFIPKPKVSSAVLKFIPKKTQDVDLMDEKTFFQTVKAGFGQRRKTLSNSLKQINGLSSDDVKKALNHSNIDAMRRAEL